MHYDPHRRAFDIDGRQIIAVDPVYCEEDTQPVTQDEGSLELIEGLLETITAARSKVSKAELSYRLLLVAGFTAKLNSAPKTLRELGEALGMTPQGAKDLVSRSLVALKTRGRKPSKNAANA